MSSSASTSATGQERGQAKGPAFRSIGSVCRLVVTGGLCSGKSMVVKAFENDGMATLSASKVGATLLQRENRLMLQLEDWASTAWRDYSKTKFRKAIERQLTQWYLQPDFPAELKHFLDKEVHLEIKRFLYGPDGTAIRVVEDPLVFEKGHAHFYDRVWLVEASPLSQTERLIARDKLRQLEATKAVALYCYPVDSKREAADVVLRNDATPNEFRAAYDVHIQQLRSFMAFSQRFK